MTNFDKLTASPGTLGAFLASIPTTGGPWDEAFRKEYCTNCGPLPNTQHRSHDFAWLLPSAQPSGSFA